MRHKFDFSPTKSMAQVVVDTHGNKVYRENGRLHRLDGPAVEWTSGTKCWYKNGLRHRSNGPAIEWDDGSSEWWKNGVQVPEPKCVKI